MKTGIAILPCCFGAPTDRVWNKTGICFASMSRIATAIGIGSKHRVPTIFLGGNVWENKKTHNSLSLQELMRKNLLDMLRSNREGEYIYDPWICPEHGGFNSSTNAQIILKLAKNYNYKKLYVVSSKWHLWVLKPIYEYWSNLMSYRGELEFHASEPSACGSRTLLIYAGYSVVVRLAIKLGCFARFDAWLNARQEKRTENFRFIGCA